MRHLGQRIVLIHELRELARTEEFFNSRRDRLSIDQILRHQAFALCHRQALFNSTLYPDKTNAELVLCHLTDRTNTTVTQMVDVINNTFTVTNSHQRFEDINNVFTI